MTTPPLTKPIRFEARTRPTHQEPEKLMPEPIPTVYRLTLRMDMLRLERSRFFDSSSSPHKLLIHCPDDGCIPPNTKPHDIAKPGRQELPIWILGGFFVVLILQHLSFSLPRPADSFWLSVFSPF